MIKTILKPLSFIPALLLMYMIFSFSAQTGDMSSQLSYKASYKIVETVDYVFSGGLEDWEIDEWANKINFITRKLAHMTEYFALAIAVSFPLYVYGLHGILLMLVAGLICVGFACGDEYHQSFVAGRGPSMRDVCIDSVGIFFGIILVRIVGWTGRKTIFKDRKPKVKKVKRKKIKYQEEPYYEYPPYEPRGGYEPNYYGNRNNDHAGRPYPNDYPPDDYYDGPERDFEDEWYDEEVNFEDSPNPDYAPGWQDPSKADDWGLETDYEDEYWGPNPHDTGRPYPPPNYGNAAPPPPKKKKKKEKDWFFDM